MHQKISIIFINFKALKKRGKKIIIFQPIYPETQWAAVMTTLASRITPPQ